MITADGITRAISDSIRLGRAVTIEWDGDSESFLTTLRYECGGWETDYGGEGDLLDVWGETDGQEWRLKVRCNDNE